MKKLNLFVLLLMSVVLLLGCDKEEAVVKPDTPVIEINTPEVLFMNDGGNNTISFSATENWTAEILNPGSNSWCSIHPTSGPAGNATITVTTVSNDTPDDRSVSFVIKSGSASKTVVVSQKQKNSLVVSDKYVNVGKDGGEVEVKVSANIEYDVNLPSDVSWITQVKNRSVSETSIFFNVDPNTSDLSRNASITITDKNQEFSETIYFIQQGAKTELKVAYSVDEEELEGWSGGLFGGEGTYILGKPHGENGYLVTMGNILEEKSALVYLDEHQQIREIFIDNIAFAIEHVDGGRMDVSIIESGSEVVTEQIIPEGSKSVARSSGDHSQQAGILNLISNMQGIYDATQEIAKNKGFSKKGAIMALANKTDGIRNLIKALGGPDIFNENFSYWLGVGMNVLSLIELGGMYKVAEKASPASACILVYLGLRATYLELYDEHIEAYFGSCQTQINGVESKNNQLNIDVDVTGYETWFTNIECGVIVKKKALFKPKYKDGASTQTVTHNGIYTFVESGIKVKTTYTCRPFLIDKNRVSLWKGFIGDMVGPLVRYGEPSDVEVQCSVSTGDCLSVTQNSAVVKCSFTNVSGLECGVCVTSDDEASKFSAGNVDGEQEISLSGLKPGTTYNYWAYVNVDGEYYNGEVKSFTTELPDLYGSWTCTETHYNFAGNPYQTTYTVTLNEDGSVLYSESDNIISSSWSYSKTGEVIINITDLATMTNASGKEWKGQVNNLLSPNTITGYTQRWNANHIGSFVGDAVEFIMSR